MGGPLSIYLKTILWNEVGGYQGVVTEASCLIVGCDCPRKRLSIYLKQVMTVCCKIITTSFLNTKLNYKTAFIHKQNVKEPNQVSESVTE
jgi:hypothetical protein